MPQISGNMKFASLLLLLPSALLADVALPLQEVINQANPQVVDSSSEKVGVRLAKDFEAPVVAVLDASELSDAVSAGSDDSNREWLSAQKNLTINGYVENASVTKDLDILQGAQVWADIAKTTPLTSVDVPSEAKLLDAERGMGHIELTGMRTVYFPSAKAPVATPDSVSSIVEDAPTTSPVDENTSLNTAAFADEISPASQTQGIPTPKNIVPAAGLRSVEGTIRKGWFGGYYMEDDFGNKLCSIAKSSPISFDALERYRNMKVVLVGEMSERGAALKLSVRSVLLR